MKKQTIRIVLPLILISVLTAAVFGFLIMNESGRIMAGCSSGSMSGAGCSQLPPFVHLESHFHAFQDISTAAIGASSLLVAFLLLFLAIVIPIKRQDDASESVPVSKLYDNFILPTFTEFMRWCALHEKRDPSFTRAMNN